MSEQLSLFAAPKLKIPTALNELRKVDLHRHLLGSVTPAILLDTARRHNLQLPAESARELEDLLTLKQPVAGLRPYFRPWSSLSRLIQTPEILRDLMYAVLVEAHHDNVVYTEIRAGWGMTGREAFPVTEFLEALRQGIDRAATDYPIIGRIVFGITRHLLARHTPRRRQQLWTQISHAVTAYKNSPVVGFDLSGIEQEYPPHLFADEFREVRDLGFPVTVHCGETTGPDDVRDAISNLGPARLSHALAAARDRELLDFLADSSMPIEVCPTSNWLSSSVTDLAAHPVRAMHERGLRITVNTDNPAICRTTLSAECALLTTRLGFSTDEVVSFMRNAVNGMFGDADLKKRVATMVGSGTVPDGVVDHGG